MGFRALLMVDLQNDFCPSGALGVAGGDGLMAHANRLQAQFDWVVATQDWHPVGHLGFASMHPGKYPGECVELDGIIQRLWPDHCVQGTWGADFHSELNTSRISHIVQKGADPLVDSYSAFFDNAKRHSTGLAGWLRERSITDLYVMGIATDYCVKFTCLDAVACGFNVWLLPDACRGVNVQAGDSEASVAEMQAAGVKLMDVTSALIWLTAVYAGAPQPIS